ncbi:MAG: acyl transferase [Leptolyngbyaceae cyanobacterium SL_7_1]|nr:acyl transferase [Leptolyngbyaceae cyanobacterium SL_7_1]
MTPLSVVLAYFPTVILLLSAASFVYLCAHPGLGAIALFLFILYGLPVLTYRLHQWRYPVQPGISYLRGHAYSPWWGSHQIQAIYIAFPALETVLRLIPGAFSLWLRLWGAKVGRQVYWTPKLEIADRGLVEIGDRVVFGHGIGIYSHIIKPRRQDLMLYVKPVKIGNGVFLGAGSHVAPGVVIADGTYLPVATHLYPNQTTPKST